MPLHIVRNDITKMQVDAIVNAANETLLGGGGVDGAIHRAAGPELLAECRGLGGCRVGEAKATKGYRLPCRYVIHTVGPIWTGGSNGERENLLACYRNSLILAEKLGCESVAFPLISAGAYGYPREQAMETARAAIGDFLENHEMTVYLTVFDRDSFLIGEKLYREIAAYIDDKYAEEHLIRRSQRMDMPVFGNTDAAYSAPMAAPPPAAEKSVRKGIFRKRTEPKHQEEAEYLAEAEYVEEAALASCRSLEDALQTLDESFSQTLLRRIDEKGMTDVQCYKKANIDRKLFSKIRSDAHYRPSKATALAFAVALELSLDETKDLLMKAGFALSHSSKFDIIVEYFISRGDYDIFEINEALFAFDQSLLGG